MARSKGVIISVKIPIAWDMMTKRTQQRLRQIVGRDTRAIRAFLGVIEQHEKTLLTGRAKNRIQSGELNKLTLTAFRVKPGYSQRPFVLHDMKARFPRMSTNELVECSQTAIALYESYLALRSKKSRNVSRPCVITSTRRIPRWVFSQRFKLFERKAGVPSWWLNLRDSLDSAPKQHFIHDRLLIPLKTSPFHINQLRRGDVRALKIFKDRKEKWWVAFAVRVDVPEPPTSLLPFAVIGIDLGIMKAACATLVTPEKVRETRYFVQKDKVRIIRNLDRLVADLQREMQFRKNNGRTYDKVAEKLRKLRAKRENVAREYDRVLVSQLIRYISELSEKFTVFVAIGRLRNIRNIARKGNYRGRRYRGMIHSWAFARITYNLKHQLAQKGWPVGGKDPRFRVIPESWTSIMCWKCGSKGKRPKQHYFKCSSCGHKTNADRNGSINIAGRLIMLTGLLHSVRGLGKWADSVTAGKSSRLKTRKKRTSQGKSLLPYKGDTSHSGESAAVHFAQTSILSFGDKARISDNDPAVVNTVEKLSAVGIDAPISRQEKEARSAGGVPSR
jgi:transposase